MFTNPKFNPAASYDFGMFLWGQGEHPHTADARYYNQKHFDMPTACLGYDRIEASYEADIEARIDAELEKLA